MLSGIFLSKYNKPKRSNQVGTNKIKMPSIRIDISLFIIIEI